MTRLLVLTVLLLLAGLAPAPAQGLPDYGRLYGTQGTPPAPPAEESRSAPPRSAGSFSRPAFDPAQVPSAEAYGKLTGAMAPLGAAQRLVDVFRVRLFALAVNVPKAVPELLVTLAAAGRTGEPAYFLGVAIFALVLLAVGRAVSLLFAHYIARPLFVGLQRPAPRGYREKLPVLVYRVALTLVGTAIAVATASLVGLFHYDGHEATLNTVIIIFACYAAIMLMDTVWRMILCPFLANYRIPQIDTAAARKLYRWVIIASSFGVLSIGFGYWVRALGVPRDVHVIFAILLSAITVAGLLAMIRTNAGTINRIILAGQPREQISWVTLLSLRLWAPAAVLYLIASWGKLSFDLVIGVDAEPVGLLVPYLVVLAGAIVYAVTNYVIERFFERSREIAAINARLRAASRAEAAAPAPGPVPGRAGPVPEDERARLEQEVADEKGHDGDTDRGIDGEGDGEGGGPVAVPDTGQATRLARPRRGMQSFEDLARRIASLFAIGAGAYALLYFWGGPDIFEETMVLGIAEDIIDLVFVGYVAYHAARIWIDRRIEREGGHEAALEPGEGEGGGAGATRLATLLPLVRSFVLAVIVIAIGLALASELGLNVAPLFAGAGIVGLAIGFGSQTLVRDILSGVFFLMDDAFRRGEYIDVGEVKGTVEKISLRSFQLRHHLGMLHTIPFGEIKHLTNFSRDWVMMKLPLRLTYDTDVEKVRKLVKKLGQDLLADPVIGDKFLQPLKSQGVIEMQDSAMIVRVKFMTKPGEQWVIRKRVYQDIRDVFEREGIHFAHREVTVRIPDLPKDRPLTEREKQAVGSAARGTLDLIEGEALAMGGRRGAIDDR